VDVAEDKYDLALNLFVERFGVAFVATAALIHLDGVLFFDCRGESTSNDLLERRIYFSCFLNSTTTLVYFIRTQVTLLAQYV
jgi:hypothetical protein